MSDNIRVTLLFNAGKKDEKAVQFLTRTPSNRVRKEIAKLQMQQKSLVTKKTAEARKSMNYTLKFESGEIANHELDMKKIDEESSKALPLLAELEDANTKFLIDTIRTMINFDRLSESKPKLSDAELEMLDDEEFWDEQDLDSLRSDQLKFFRKLGI